MKPYHPILLVAVAVLAPACTIAAYAPAVPIAPPGVHVRAEVARGYAAYAAPLAAWGTWLPDSIHGVLWCPGPAATGGEPFQPYLNRGHWDVSSAPIGGMPAGSPTWRSEASDTWSEITSHHGWWVRVADDGPSPWCWVPGAEETAARVLWREGDGFVGWAPEPPLWVACDEEDYDDSLDWTFTLLGTLLDGSPDQNQLTGPARDAARSATAPARSPGGSLPRNHVGPSGTSVTAARKILADYIIVHPNAIAATSTSPGAGGKSGSKGSSGSSGTKRQASDEKAKATEAPMLPSAMQYYDAFLTEPPVGPPGIVPGMRSAGLAGGSGRAPADTGAFGGAFSASSGAHARSRGGAASALYAEPSGAHAGSAPSSGRYTYTPSRSGHSSGSHHASGRSSRSGRSHR